MSSTKRNSDKLNNLLKICNAKRQSGESLKEIYNNLKQGYGIVYGPVLFAEFYNANKHDEKFVLEFQKTTFIS